MVWVDQPSWLGRHPRSQEDGGLTDAVAQIILEDHIRGCVAHGIRSGEGDAHIDEVMEVIRRYVRS